ncbi:MAG: hypothetical protein IPO81_21515 [Kouleothrix sp.]|nr:hypothetical protein [Kouleothrix sp.]
MSGSAGTPPCGATTTPRRSGGHSATGSCGSTNRAPFFHDGTERPITRPKDPDEQSAWYSGKKKRHTVKNVLLGAATGTVPFLSDTYEGGRHDKPIADQTPYPLPEGSELLRSRFCRFYARRGRDHTTAQETAREGADRYTKSRKRRNCPASGVH